MEIFLQEKLRKLDGMRINMDVFSMDGFWSEPECLQKALRKVFGELPGSRTSKCFGSAASLCKDFEDCSRSRG